MKWYANLYVGEQIKGKEKKVIRQITKDGKPRHMYVIAFPANEANLLDIMPVHTALFYEDVHVIGLAKNKREAIRLAARILDEVYRRTGGFAVRAYLKEKQTQGLER